MLSRPGAGQPVSSPRGGRVRTGDLGRLDAEGQLHIVGRSKEIVIRGGNFPGADLDLLGVFEENTKRLTAALSS